MIIIVMMKNLLINQIKDEQGSVYNIDMYKKYASFMDNFSTTWKNEYGAVNSPIKFKNAIKNIFPKLETIKAYSKENSGTLTKLKGIRELTQDEKIAKAKKETNIIENEIPF